MKRKSILLLAFVLLMTGACNPSQDTQYAPVSRSRTIHFEVGDPMTKTIFGTPEGLTYPTLWTVNKDVSVSLNYGTPASSVVTPSADAKSANFDYVMTTTLPSPYRFHVISPASAVMSMSPSRSAWVIDIPETQTPLATSPDEDAQILTASSAEYTVLPDKLNVHFSHVTSYIKLTLQNLDKAPDDAIQSVSISSTVPLAGQWYYEPETGTMTKREVTYSINALTASTSDIWFACAPVDLSGKTLEVIVTTANGTFTQTRTFPAGRTLTPGKIAIFNIDFTGVAMQPLPTPDPVLAYSNYGAYLDGTHYLYNQTTDQLSRELMSDGTVTFTVFAPVEGQVLEFAGIPANATLGNSFTLKLTYTYNGIVSPISNQTYDVTVIQEKDNMVWLSDGANNGFIVKR